MKTVQLKIQYFVRSIFLNDINIINHINNSKINYQQINHQHPGMIHVVEPSSCSSSFEWELVDLKRLCLCFPGKVLLKTSSE